MQALTSDDPEEVALMVEYMTATTGGTYVMHEAFNADDPTIYSRDYFTWPCALYAHTVLTRILGVNEGEMNEK
jgi:meiotically up-regulated gene 157 (Mug157) protein